MGQHCQFCFLSIPLFDSKIIVLGYILKIDGTLSALLADKGYKYRYWKFYCVNTSYLVDRCICPAPCRSRQTLEKNVLSWALAGTGSVLFIRQVAV